ncbi:isocitrate lyase/phosphoenolpyruvate mutase family protein, partial [Micromonospora sp. ATA51]|uniref:isocitrate lyase/phosphoenolpyruvate mutase family protein n=1 Tax=Micromonospora sp. ATA51 TaxID=2806098 RepID=UPI0035CA9818
MNDQHTRALHFRSLHVPGEPLVLVNAWDAASARIVAAAAPARSPPPAPGRLEPRRAGTRRPRPRA